MLALFDYLPLEGGPSSGVYAFFKEESIHAFGAAVKRAPTTDYRLPTTDYRPPTTDYYGDSGSVAMYALAESRVPTTDH